MSRNPVRSSASSRLASTKSLEGLGRVGVGLGQAVVGGLAAELVVQPGVDALVELLHLPVGEVVEGVPGEEVARQAVVDVAQEGIALEALGESPGERVPDLLGPVLDDHVDAAGAAEAALNLSRLTTTG